METMRTFGRIIMEEDAAALFGELETEKPGIISYEEFKGLTMGSWLGKF